MAHKLLLFNFLILDFFFATCNSLEPLPPNGEKPTLNLELEDASCIEAWIKLTTTNLQLPTTVTLKQNNIIRTTINLVKPDTLLYIDSLLPNINYNFQVSSIQHQVSSNKLSATTLDTTSHNFNFQSWTFGEHSSSVLYDVAIIDENNIWAVGEIYLNDSLGQPDPHIYNAVYWDGIEWEIKRIPFSGTCSAVIYPPIRSIFIFSEDDIWFARGGSLVHFDGANYFNDCGMNSFLTGSINKIWGSSSNDLYVVGNNGNIAYYNSTSWQKIESGTELNIGDIWGVADHNGGYNKYLAAVDEMLIIGEGNNLQRVNTEQGHSLGSVWGMINGLVYTAGGFGLALYKNYNWENVIEPITSTIRVVRGQNHNDVYGLGMPGIIIHFNGYTWQTTATGQNNINYRIEVKNDFATTVGWQGDKALITLILR